MQTLTQEKLPLDGTALRERGIERSLNHAECELPGWKIRAMDYLINFLRAQGSVPFQAEYFRAWAYSRGLDRPPSERAFGGIILKAKKDNLISFVRYESVSNPKAHKAFASVWKAA